MTGILNPKSEKQVIFQIMFVVYLGHAIIHRVPLLFVLKYFFGRGIEYVIKPRTLQGIKKKCALSLPRYLCTVAGVVSLFFLDGYQVVLSRATK